MIKHSAKKLLLIQDFLDIQRKSFYEFIEKGIVKQFQKLNPISRKGLFSVGNPPGSPYRIEGAEGGYWTGKNAELIFFGEHFKLTYPLFSSREAVLNGQTYGGHLYIPVQYKTEEALASWKNPHNQNKQVAAHKDQLLLLPSSRRGSIATDSVIQTQWVCLGFIPFITKRGHFISNGSPRVIVNQLARCPGVFFQKKTTATGFSSRRDEQHSSQNASSKKPAVLQKQSPYFNYVGSSKTASQKSSKKFYADIVPDRGTWLRLEIDKKNCIWARIKRTPKIALPLFLQLFNIDLRQMERELFMRCKGGLSLLAATQSSSSSFFLKNSYLENHPASTSEALKRVIFEVNKLQLEKQARIESVALTRNTYNNEGAQRREKTLDSGYPSVVPGSKHGQTFVRENQFSDQIGLELKLMQQTTSLEMGKKFFYSMLVNPRNYDLSKLGRLRLNKKFNICVSGSQTILTKFDLYQIVKELFERALADGPFDDIDHLKNKRVRTSGELLENQFRLGLTLLEKSIYPKLGSYFKPPGATPSGTAATRHIRGPHSSNETVAPFLVLGDLFQSKHITNSFKDFFNTSPLAQYMDQTNPLAEITHKRRISSLGPGGITRETAGMNIRGIHPSHYGRICPIETPEGKNAGLVNSITIYSRKNNHGYMETPFFRVIESQVHQQCSFSAAPFGGGGPIFLTAEKEEAYQVSPPDINISKFCFLPIKNPVPARKSTTFSQIASDQIDLISLCSLQMISIATSLIPFLEHDDANRALMGSNMQRQAIALMIPERPLVGTGLEARVIADSRVVVQSDTSGYILYVSNEKIIVQTFYKNEK
jgi:DNA-directed RNA polymerase subunit beta